MGAPARCVWTRAAQVDVATEKDVASISSALKEAIAAEDYALAAKLRDELQRLPEVELEARLRRAVEQEDYAVRHMLALWDMAAGTACSKVLGTQECLYRPAGLACKLEAQAGTSQQCRCYCPVSHRLACVRSLCLGAGTLARPT